MPKKVTKNKSTKKSTEPKSIPEESKDTSVQVESVNKKVIFDEEGFAPEVEEALNKEESQEKPVEEEENDSDDEAPEVVSLETGKQIAQETQLQAQQAVKKLKELEKELEKEKRRRHDQVLKEQSQKKAKLQPTAEETDAPAPLPSSLLESVEVEEQPANQHIREFTSFAPQVNADRWKLINKPQKDVSGFKVVSLDQDSNPYPSLRLDGRALHFLHKNLYKKKSRVPVILNMSRKEVGPAINFIRNEAALSNVGPRAIFK